MMFAIATALAVFGVMMVYSASAMLAHRETEGATQFTYFYKQAGFTIAGVILGVFVCLNVESIRQFFSWLSGTTLFNPELYFLSQLPAKMDMSETISVVLMALVLSFVALFSSLFYTDAALFAVIGTALAYGVGLAYFWFAR